MRLARRTYLHLATAAAVLTIASVVPATIASQEARSQTRRTIKIVVPLPAGGAADILARILGEQISRDHGVTIVIENRAGAGAVIGTEAVSRAAPDGNTLLLTATGVVISPHLRKVNYNPMTSFEPICQLTSTPLVVVVNSASPYRSLAEFLDAGRAKPGALTVAGVPATISQIAFEMLKRAANVDLTFVPYTGGAPAVNDLLGAHVTSVLLPLAGLSEQVKAGQLRALASTSKTRTEALPDVPTIAESGYKEFEADFWNGLLAPAKTPKETVSQLAGWFAAAMQVPEVKAKLVAQGFHPVGICGADFGAVLRQQYDEFGRIIHEAKIRAAE
jgi:tripartite-type tricarboxylate transporter receptor subunit TctC